MQDRGGVQMIQRSYWLHPLQKESLVRVCRLELSNPNCSAFPSSGVRFLYYCKQMLPDLLALFGAQ